MHCMNFGEETKTKGFLILEGLLELCDLVSDVYSVVYMEQLRKRCGYEALFVAFLVFLVPAVLSSFFSAFLRAKLLYDRNWLRSHEKTEDLHFGKLYRRKNGGRIISLEKMVEFFKLSQDAKRLAEQKRYDAII